MGNVKIILTLNFVGSYNVMVRRSRTGEPPHERWYYNIGWKSIIRLVRIIPAGCYDTANAASCFVWEFSL